MDRDRHAFGLIVLLTIWCFCFGGAVLGYVTEPGRSPVAGMPGNLATFLGWQGIAAMLAFPAWRLGRDWPPGNPVRALAAAPLVLAGAVALGLAVLSLAQRM